MSTQTLGTQWTTLTNTVDVTDIIPTTLLQYLDQSYSEIDHVKGLKTNLYPHQKKTVKAMLDAEDHRKFKATAGFSTCTYHSSASALSDPVGAGKTVEILSLILLRKRPRAISDICQFNCVKQPCHSYPNTFGAIVRKKYKIVLAPTIIFVGASVIDQWADHISTFTDFKCFCVRGIYDLEMLIVIMQTRRVDGYDIVLVKNGKVSRPVELPIKLEAKNKRRQPYIYNVVSNMRQYCWARLVVDDVDTIGLPPDAGRVPALFTWYVSSTMKKMQNSRVSAKFTNTADALLFSSYPCSDVFKNAPLFHMMNIRCDPDFIQKTNEISSPQFFAYTFKNPNNMYIGLLGAMNSEESAAVMEMLNGDAIDTAASQIGIKTDSVADIFQQILGAQYDTYRHSVNILAFIEKNEDSDGRSPYSHNPDQDDTYTKKDLMSYRPIKYNYPGLRGLLTSTREEREEMKSKSGVAIQRVKSNLDQCVVCRLEFDEDESAVICKCCCIVVCESCCFGGIFPDGSTTGICSNCRREIGFKAIIYLGEGFDMDNIAQDKLDVVYVPDEKDEEPEEDLPSVPRTKMSAIIDITRGDIPREQIRVDVCIHNLMNGRSEGGDAGVSKVLIFASFTETLYKICDELNEEKIDHWRLGGTHDQIRHTVEKFQNSIEPCVLVINSIKHCAGLNLQSATDLIFAHKIQDPSIESQVAGRGQRLGRKSPLRIHYMFYQNEFDAALVSGQVRVID